MKTFTQQQRAKLMEQTRQALDRAAEGMSTREIMAHIYVENLEGKTLEQGELMADAIIEAVADFDSRYTQAKNDLDGFLDRTLEDMVKGMTQAERCTCWMKVAAAIQGANDALSQGHEIPAEDILKRIEALSVTEDMATDALEAELLGSVKEAITGSGIMPAVLASQAEALNGLADGDSAAAVLLDLGSRELDFRAVAAMITYTQVKNGELENIPVDMKLEQITTLVCAEVEQARICAAVEQGKMPENTAQLLLNILGAIALVTLLPAVLATGVILTESLGIGILALPAAACAVLLILHGMNKGYDWWCAETGNMIRGFSARLDQLAAGTERLVNHISDTVIPNVKERLTALWNWLKGVFAGNISAPRSRTPVSEDIAQEDIVDAVEWTVET